MVNSTNCLAQIQNGSSYLCFSHLNLLSCDVAYLWGAKTPRSKNAHFWCSNIDQIEGESFELRFSNSSVIPGIWDSNSVALGWDWRWCISHNPARHRCRAVVVRCEHASEHMGGCAPSPECLTQKFWGGAQQLAFLKKKKKLTSTLWRDD